jgi:hypothetical protein
VYDKKEQSHFHRPATVRAFCLRVETANQCGPAGHPGRVNALLLLRGTGLSVAVENTHSTRHQSSTGTTDGMPARVLDYAEMFEKLRHCKVIRVGLASRVMKKHEASFSNIHRERSYDPH